MLAGKKSAACAGCYEKEKLGIRSPRADFNDDGPAVRSAVSRTRPDGFLEGVRPRSIQLIFSNKCNFRCRTCNPWWSSAWVAEAKRFGAEMRFWPSKDGESLGGHQVDFKIVRPTDARGELWTEIEPFLPRLKEIQFVGGEPLAEAEHFEFLKRLIDAKRTGIALSYNTNFSITRLAGDDVFRLWQRFRKVEVVASIDGAAERGEYLRKGFRWDLFLRNRERLAAVCPEAAFSVMTTLSVMNVLHLPDLHRELLERRVIGVGRDSETVFLSTPPEYSIQVLPPHLKRLVLRQCRSFALELIAKYGRGDGARTRLFLRDIPRFMMAGDRVDLLPQFRARTMLLDNSRGESFPGVFPELAELMTAAAGENDGRP